MSVDPVSREVIVAGVIPSSEVELVVGADVFDAYRRVIENPEFNDNEELICGELTRQARAHLVHASRVDGASYTIQEVSDQLDRLDERTIFKINAEFNALNSTDVVDERHEFHPLSLQLAYASEAVGPTAFNEAFVNGNPDRIQLVYDYNLSRAKQLAAITNLVQQHGTAETTKLLYAAGVGAQQIYYTEYEVDEAYGDIIDGIVTRVAPSRDRTGEDVEILQALGNVLEQEQEFLVSYRSYLRGDSPFKTKLGRMLAAVDHGPDLATLKEIARTVKRDIPLVLAVIERKLQFDEDLDLENPLVRRLLLLKDREPGIYAEVLNNSGLLDQKSNKENN